VPIPQLAAPIAAVGLGVTLDDLSFNQGSVDENGVQWHLGRLEGWDSPSLREDLDDQPLAHGAYRGTSYYGAREIGLRGTLVSPHGLEALRVAKDRLAYACDLTDTDGVLTVRETPSKQAAVRRAGRLRYAQVGQHLLRWELDLTAADPRKYATVERTLTLPASQTGSAQNDGTFRSGAPMQIAFHGPMGSGTLSAADRSLSVQSLAAGEVLTVDTLEGTALLADGSTGYSRITSTGPLPVLPALAATTVSLAATDGYAVITWRDAWI
jgi:hypothetical protein